MSRGKPRILISLESRKLLKPTAFYTTKELGSIFRVSKTSINRIIKSGLINFVWIGKSRRFSGENILDFLSKIIKFGTIA